MTLVPGAAAAAAERRPDRNAISPARGFISGAPLQTKLTRLPIRRRQIDAVIRLRARRSGPARRRAAPWKTMAYRATAGRAVSCRGASGA